MTKKITIDFETRSEISLKQVGAWIYSKYPSTEVMCLSWSDGNLESGQWQIGDPEPVNLFKLVSNGNVVEAHNSFFETCIWLNICHRRYGWPEIPFSAWRCSAAKAAAASLPRELGEAGRVMKLSTVKDETYGRWAMLKLSKPRPRTGGWYDWFDAEDDWAKMLAYNRNDVAAEEALSEALPDLLPTELKVWKLTELINFRGMAIDVEGCRAAVKISEEYAERLTKEFQQITGLDTAGQRAKFIEWLAIQNIHIANSQAETLDLLLKNGIANTQVKRAIEIVRTLGRASIKKYQAMLTMADTDGRARGCFLYHGAHTGRFAGRNLQPQNFKREGPKDMNQAWEDIRHGDLEYLELLHGDPLQFLSGALRGAIWAPPGRQLFAGDYAQIEVRVLFWLAGEKKGLDIFRRNEDMYLEMASTIWNRRVSKEESEKRFLGKQATLALGFGAGFVKFLVHCRDLGAPSFKWEQICELVPAATRESLLHWIITDGWEMVKRLIPNPTKADARELVLAKYVVDKYRAAYGSTVVKYWSRIEDAVKSAIQNPGTWFSVGNVSYNKGPKFLNCRLPSGRIMRYFDAQLDRKGEITYRVSENGKWIHAKTWGGKLVENIVQAVARDICTDAMLRLAQSPPYDEITMTVHDEIVCELAEDEGKLDEFTAIMSSNPEWAQGIPIKVESWKGKRYHK